MTNLCHLIGFLQAEQTGHALLVVSLSGLALPKKKNVTIYFVKCSVSIININVTL